MKLLTFVDTHTSLRALQRIIKKARKENPDLILCAGDISIFERGIGYILFYLNKLKKPVYNGCYLYTLNIKDFFLIILILRGLPGAAA